MENKDTKNKSELSKAFSSMLNTMKTSIREANPSI